MDLLAGVAQWAERPTKIQSQYRRGFESPVRQGCFPPRVDFQWRLSFGVCTSLCTTACINICTHVKNPKRWQPYIVWTHTHIAMGSAALGAAVPYPGKVTWIYRRGNAVLYTFLLLVVVSDSFCWPACLQVRTKRKWRLLTVTVVVGVVHAVGHVQVLGTAVLGSRGTTRHPGWALGRRHGHGVHP